MSSPSNNPPFASLGRSQSYASITNAGPMLRTEVVGDGKFDKLWELMKEHLPSDCEAIKRDIAKHAEYTLACSRFSLTPFNTYRAASHTIRDRLIETWNDTEREFTERGVKRVSYLSLEFLMGRSMLNMLLNMDLDGVYREAASQLGAKLEELAEQETDAALGNGGLGRLAACFLDSMATLNLPAWGYGIRYNYGIFKQLIKNGAQVEVPDFWLTAGNPWEIPRLDVVEPVRFYGSVAKVAGPDGEERAVWSGGEVVHAMAYDSPIPGFDTFNTINLRLWAAMPSNEFDFGAFNAGDHSAAMAAKLRAEAISSVLYPSDSTPGGKELRLKQQYFFVSATLRDVIRRFKRVDRYAPRGCAGGSGGGGISPPRASSAPFDGDWNLFSEANAVQLNDTHPSIAIPELMRLLVDEEGVKWATAWDITQRTFGYTNHTILPEALEKWSVDLMGHLLPRLLDIIYKINWIFLEGLRHSALPPSPEFIAKVSLIEDGAHGKSVRMANLACVGSHSINGVAALHTELVKSHVFPELYSLFPARFNNKTNGVTPRRWINQANPALAAILTKWLGSAAWLKDLSELAKLRLHADDPALTREWRAMKEGCKQRLAARIQRDTGVAVSPHALFDVQVKRIHEYKRQQLNALYCIHRYRWIKSLTPRERACVIPRVTIFGGKAAPGYDMAKRIIRLIHAVAAKVNSDPDVGDVFKVVFLPNYNVSLAEIIIPASDISQHISTAGMEASGTSNMKFAMNGGSIIGTMDGANIEIAEEVGAENLFIFGALTPAVAGLREARRGLPQPYEPALRAVLEDLEAGRYLPAEDARPLLDTLRWENDYYLVTEDFADYCRAQNDVDRAFSEKEKWTRRSIMCTAGMGKFSTDRTIEQYAKDIWGAKPLASSGVPAPASTGSGPSSALGSGGGGGGLGVRTRSFLSLETFTEGGGGGGQLRF